MKQQDYCPTCDEAVERDEIVNGYEFAKGTSAGSGKKSSGPGKRSSESGNESKK